MTLPAAGRLRLRRPPRRDRRAATVSRLMTTQPPSSASAVAAAPAPRRRASSSPAGRWSVLYARLPALVGAGARPAHLLRDGGRDGRDPAHAGARCACRAASASGCCSWSGCSPASSWSAPSAPGTVPGGGLGRVAGFGVWAGWYVAITVVMLYVANTARELPTQRIVRLLAWMFVVTAGFGVLAVLAPTLEFKSPMELVLPHSLASSNFVRTLVHPSLSSSSDFLGYVQPRPTAPVPLLQRVGQQHRALPAVLHPGLVRPGRRLAPEARPGRAGRGRSSRSPSRSTAACGSRLALAAVYAAVRLAVNGRARALQALVAAVLVGGIVFVSSPLYDTARAARGDAAQQRPPRRHGRDRHLGRPREGSPVVGFGTTRTMQGSFSSLAGGETDAVPPVRRSAARHPGLHVAAGPDHRVRRHRALPGLLRASSSSAAHGARPARRRRLHGPARRGAVLLRLRLPRARPCSPR